MQDTWCCKRKQAFHLTEINKLTLASTLPMPKRRKNGRGAIEAADGIAKGHMLHGRCLFWVADQVRQARGMFYRRAISPKLRPWSGAAKGRHGHHHQVRVGFDEVRVIELQFWQYAAGVVFNQGVRRCHELQQQFAEEARTAEAANGLAPVKPWARGAS